jgi:hypothetical protein
VARELVRYRAGVYDSARWEGFALRPGDIVISTPPKAGTTWTQMICALLVLQQVPLEQPLSLVSPWLDMRTAARAEIVARLDAQTHRRFMKTHTPLDGLPWDDRVTYLCVARDPRDVAFSINNHWDNLDVDAFDAARRAAERAGGGAEEDGPTRMPERPDDDRARFWMWVDNPTPPPEVSSSLLRTVRHVETFWAVRDLPNVVLVHYDDLGADLDDAMRELARRLGVTVPEERWPEFVEAATFERMRASAEMTAPGAEISLWHDNREFFHRGTSGQWRDVLDADDLQRYRERVEELAPPDLSAWLHRPPLADGCR